MRLQQQVQPVRALRASTSTFTSPAGGRSHMGVKIDAAMGAHVVLFTTSADKREDALRLGAHEVVLARCHHKCAVVGHCIRCPSGLPMLSAARQERGRVESGALAAAGQFVRDIVGLHAPSIRVSPDWAAIIRVGQVRRLHLVQHREILSVDFNSRLGPVNTTAVHPRSARS